MALAAYGKPQKEILEKIAQIVPELNRLDYFDSVNILEKMFPEISQTSGNILEKEKLNFSASVQKLFSDRRIEDVRKIITETEKRPGNLVMAGGVSLNLDTNTEILKAFPNIKQFIAPCCDDTGQSLGAICVLISEILGVRPSASLPYLGMGYNEIIYDSDSLDRIVDILLEDGVVILHNGQAEIGPRSLGNRSFIARPDKIEVKKKLSEKIKQRESYRPVAPVVLEEKVHDYFIGPDTSPFMLYKYDIVESMRKIIPGAVHVDNSARVQTVNRKTNPFLYDLIKKFGDRTGIYVLLNTSLNLKGNPIANTIEDSHKIYDKIEEPKILVCNGIIQ